MKHETSHSDHFDLLPFIAVLLCVMGCLLLVTISMSAVSVGVGVGEKWVTASASSDNGQSDFPRGMIPSTRPSTQRKPVLIEWNGTKAVVHRKEGKIEVAWSRPRVIHFQGMMLRLADEGGEAANRGLDEVLADLTAKRDSEYALFAIRPSGFSTFQMLADEFREKEIGVGYEPIEQGRAVKLDLRSWDHENTSH